MLNREQGRGERVEDQQGQEGEADHQEDPHRDQPAGQRHQDTPLDVRCFDGDEIPHRVERETQAQHHDWGLIIFASLLGSMLVVRGAMAAVFPTLDGTLGTVIVVALTALGIFYHYRKNAPKTAGAAK